MRIWGKSISPFVISVTAVIVATALVCIFAFSCSSNVLTFKTTFYFVCYKTEDNAVSASSVSNAVSSYGGAGYILEYNGNFYVTVSCYYSGKDADSVSNSLKKKNLNCSVLKVETKEYPLNAGCSESVSKLYKGNLETLQSLSSIAYNCANALDTGEYGQSQAKSAISGIATSLKGLLNSNKDNCFSPHLRRLIAVCEDASGGIIYSKDLRKLQIAIADTIINIKLN